VSKKPHFDINAAVVRQLGAELVSDEVTALIELAKNAYDADASYASVVVDTKNIFQNEKDLYFTEERGFIPTKGYITVEDDGTGMGYEEIVGGWLTISFSHKRRMRAEGKLTPKKHRTPLGDKGLGRLSAQRLGHRLEMFTCKEKLEAVDEVSQAVDENESKTEYHVAFDWRDFTEDKSLTAVPLHFQSELKEKPRQGTKLVITNLREPDIWSGKTQDKLVGQLSQLIFPFAKARPFSVYLIVNGVRVDLETIAESLRDVAVSRFKFSFDKNKDKKLRISGKIRLTRLKGIGREREELYNQLVGQDQGREFLAFLTNPENKHFLSGVHYIGKDGWFVSYEETLDLGSLGELALADSEKVASPGKFYGEIDEFFFRGVNLEPLEDVFSKVADYRDTVKQHVGVRVYRDGFGIRPYGLDGSDWLNLGGGQTSGLSYYSPRPQNIIGYVALTAKENYQLEEKTDREGFVDTPYSRNFFRILDAFVSRLDVFFNNLGRSYNEYRKQQAEKSQGFLPPEQFVPEAREITAAAHSVQQQVDRLDSGLDQIKESIQSVVERAKDTPLLASQEERQLAPILDDANIKLTEARALVQELQSLLQRLKQLEPTANSIAARLEILEEQLVQFSELAGLGLTAEALSHEIHTVADRLAERTKALNDNLRKRGVVDAKIVSYTEYVNSAISTLRKQLSHLAPSLRYVREHKDLINLHEFFTELQEFYSSGRFKTSGVQVVLEKAFDDFAILINKGKLTQVVDNIILNSEYWLREATRRGDIASPKIMIRSKRPFVAIYDNGIGIDPSIETSLFQPFVTTKPKNIGRGLGLFIVRELLDSSGCSISLLPDRNEFDRRYIFQMDFTGAINE
jgi:signal transduction histidine kinase